MLEKFKKHKVKNSYKIKGGDSGYVPRNKYRKHHASTGTSN